jgi:uncharacterized 2Fe-2S/4Fe-4S cluster protein (DUF4445 family)
MANHPSTDLCRLRIAPGGRQITLARGELLLAALRGPEAPELRLDCGGKGLCGQCRVQAAPAESLAPPTEAELDLLPPAQLAAGLRLACQARVTGDLRVTIPRRSRDSGDGPTKAVMAARLPVDPVVERLLLPPAALPEPRDAACPDVVSWIQARARAQGHTPVRLEEPHALRHLSRPEMGQGAVTLVHHRQRGVTAVLSGARPSGVGVAVDIGTTTLGAYLADLREGTVLAAAAAVNPQRPYGEDVISRIAFAGQESDGVATLQRLVIEAVNYLIERLLAEAGREPADVDEVVVAGNTTMERLFAGFHPHSLGISPYLPIIRPSLEFKAADLGLKVSPAANVYLFPVVSGFVGGDALAAALAADLQRTTETVLLIDIGTNGEAVLAHRGALWSTSCATGPALEGAHIACGMRAVAGAIHQVGIDPQGLRVEWQILGAGSYLRPLGLCGSGILDAVAAMRRCGLIRPTGRLEEGRPGVAVDAGGVGREFVLVPEAASGTGAPIVVSLRDIRQIQLAKAALAVGIEMLMERAGVERVERTILTGAFGARFNWRSAVALGMLPPAAVAAAVEPRENLAGVGAVMALLSAGRRNELAAMAERTRFVELAGQPDFGARFAAATAFPDPIPEAAQPLIAGPAVAPLK